MEKFSEAMTVAMMDLIVVNELQPASAGYITKRVMHFSEDRLSRRSL